MADEEHKPSPLERIGCSMLKSFGSLETAHKPTKQDLEKIQKLTRANIIRSSAAGAISAAMSSAGHFTAVSYYPGDDQTLNYWLVFGGITALVVGAEILFLYHDALKSSHRIAEVAGLEQFPEDPRVTGIIARAALELPCPVREDTGINPMKHVPKWKLLAATALYKAKITLSNALAKVLISKVLCRGLARAWLEMIAIPVTAFWNGWVSAKIMAEIKLRAVGPLQLDAIVPPLLEDASIDLLEVCERAVACSATASLNLHPNLLHLLSIVDKHSNHQEFEKIDQEDLLINKLKALTNTEQAIAFQIFQLSSIVDNKFTEKESGLVKQVADIVGSEFDLKVIKQQQKSFSQGLL